MTERIIELILAEGKWLSASMAFAILAVSVQVFRHRRRNLPGRLTILWSLNLFFGCMIGGMGGGHLLAISVKAALGTLDGSLLLLVPIGLVLAVPAAWLVLTVAGFPSDEEPVRRRLLGLNAWLGVSVLALGPHNFPLAAPAFFNLGYQLTGRRLIGWAIVAVASVAYLGLFVGSLVFLASGQSFEQFSGME